jgi:hypothetical protein
MPQQPLATWRRCQALLLRSNGLLQSVCGNTGNPLRFLMNADGRWRWPAYIIMGVVVAKSGQITLNMLLRDCWNWSGWRG